MNGHSVVCEILAGRMAATGRYIDSLQPVISFSGYTGAEPVTPVTSTRARDFRGAIPQPAVNIRVFHGTLGARFAGRARDFRGASSGL